MMVLIAMGVFILSHVAISRTAIKPWLISHWGRGRYLLAYSLLSIGLLGWVIWAVLTADRTPLWSTPLWSYPFAGVVSLISFVLMGIGAVSPNPLSVAFKKEGFKPKRPGFIGWMRHPIIWGLTLWAVAHIPANGDWPSLILFAGSALFGLLGIRRIEARYRGAMEPEHWAELTGSSGHIDKFTLIGASVGLTIWITFLALHPVLLGVDPAAAILSGLYPD